jgi:hypothetical protein
MRSKAMTIPLVKEDDYLFKETGVREKCHFCKTRTMYWHANTNNPVCPSCAKLHKVSELPDFGKNIRKEKRKNKLANN